MTPGGYCPGGEAASEPTALAGFALQRSGHPDQARRAADWLAEQQAANGAVGVTASQAIPCWPTSLAILLWQALADTVTFGDSLSRATQWSLDERGQAEPQQSFVGHDSTLIGWSWAANTHSWVEPTAMFVLALKSVGLSQHSRTRDAVRLLVDRLLPHGGCNYGNTIVLGQELLPHLQPTGIALMALADEQIADPRVERSLEYLERELSAETTTTSLSYGLLGLAAHNRAPVGRMSWLEAAYWRTITNGVCPYKLALIALASTTDYPFDT